MQHFYRLFKATLQVRKRKTKALKVGWAAMAQARSPTLRCLDLVMGVKVAVSWTEAAGWGGGGR